MLHQASTNFDPTSVSRLQTAISMCVEKGIQESYVYTDERSVAYEPHIDSNGELLMWGNGKKKRRGTREKGQTPPVGRRRRSAGGPHTVKLSACMY